MSERKTFSIKNYFERHIALDDGVDGNATGERVPIRVRRFSVAQLQDFMRGWDRIRNGEAARFIYRKPDGDEQALRGDGNTYVVAPGEITRRRLSEMTDADRQAYEAAKRSDDDHLAAFCASQVGEHVWLAPGVSLTVESEDGEPVTIEGGKGSGARLVEVFAGNLSMLSQLTAVIFEENTLSPEKKRELRQPSDSSTSSTTQSGAAAAAGGPTPVSTAAPVAVAGSASSGDAPGLPETIPSGSTPSPERNG